MKRKLGLALAFGCAAVRGFAATYYVATNGNDSADGTSEAPLLTIQAAVDKTVNGDTVQITAGAYPLAAAVSVTKAITVRGEADDRRAVVVDGGGAVRCFVFGNDNAWLHDLTVTNGYTAGSTDGGGIYLSGGGNVSNCVVTACYAGYRGGGIACQWRNTPARIVDCELYSNAAGGEGGGGVLLNCCGILTGSFVHNNSAPSSGGVCVWRNGTTISGLVIGCVISNNTATTATGGGLGDFCELVADTLFVSNTAATYGGAVSFDRSTHTNALVNCTFLGNRANHSGGAVDVSFGGLVCSNGVFEGNEAVQYGGCLRVGDAGASCVLDGCALSNNVATLYDGGCLYGYNYDVKDSVFLNNRGRHGGAVNLPWLTTGVSRFEACSFFGNIGNGNGGAIYRSGDTSSVFTVKSCTFGGNAATNGSGGALYASYSTLEDCVFTNNAASGGGGAVYSSYSTIEECAFTNNAASGGGGALYGINLLLRDSDFYANRTVSGSGGALNMPWADTGTSRITRCAFSLNQGVTGGGITRSNTALDDFLMEQCIFTENAATNGNGGALYGSFSRVDGCDFVGNASTADGGAVYSNFANRTNEYTSCVFSNNFGRNTGGAISFLAGFLGVSNCLFEANVNGTNGWCGGAIANVNDKKGSFLFTHSRFFHNRARYDGGAFRGTEKDPDGPTSEIRNCLMVGNSSNNGGVAVLFSNTVISACTVVSNFVSDANHPGGVSIRHTSGLINCVIYDNFNTNNGVYAANDINAVQLEATNNIAHCCYARLTGPANSSTARETPPQAHNIVSAPLFDDTGLFSLRPGSPCFNAGTNEAWMAEAFDLAGTRRLCGPQVDIGAYERYYPMGTLIRFE